MKLSVCTDGKEHRWTIQILNIETLEAVNLVCSLCRVSFQDITEELARYEEWAEAEKAGVIERDCGV